MVMPSIQQQMWVNLRETEQTQRQLDIKRAWEYYTGAQPDMLAVKTGQTNDNTAVNLARIVVDKGISFLFGNEVTWQIDETAETTTPAEQFLSDVWAQNDKMVLLHEVGQNGAIAGNPFVKIDPAPDGTIQIVNLDPGTVQAFCSPKDVADLHRYQIEYTAADARGDEVNYRQVIARDGPRGSFWTIRDYELHGQGGSWKQVDEAAWPYTWSPVHTCKNLPCANSVYGFGDLEDIKLQDTINLIASSTRKILRLHAHPRTWGKGFSAKSLETWGPGDIWTVQSPDASIQNLEMQSDLAAARAFYQDMRTALFAGARMPDLSSFQGNLGAMTNFGLRVLYADLLEKTDTKRLLYGGLIRRLNQHLCELGGFGPNVQTTLRWSDPLPSNPLEIAQEITLKQDTGLVSSETLTGEMNYSFSDEQDRLADERAAGITPPASPDAALLGATPSITGPITNTR